MTDFDIDLPPIVIWNDLTYYNKEFYEGKMIIEKVNDKYIKLTVPDEENENDIVVKIKFLLGVDVTYDARER